MGKINKLTVALVGGALAAIIGNLLGLDPQVIEAAEVVIIAALVWVTPNAAV